MGEPTTGAGQRETLDPLLTVDEVVAALRISRTAVYGLMNRRELESVHIGRARRIRQSAVQRFVAGLAESIAKGGN